MKNIICLLALGALVMPALAQESARSRIDQPTSTDLPQLGEASIQEVIAAMTLEEKVHLLVGMGMRFGPSANGPDDIPDKAPGAAGSTYGIPRLGIPSLTFADGPAGVRISPIRNGDNTKTYYATAFPVATLLASSWDTELLRTVGAAFGREVREYGVDVLLAPGMNIHRNPLGGRNFEYYSEDPLVTGRMAAAFVRGVESEGVGTSLKHFAANNQETNRMMLNTVVSERALREIYLKGFEIAVEEAQPWSVMSAYNLINGTYASESHDLLTTILRDEWGFDGFVMTDWMAGSDPVAQVASGNDVLMPGNPQQTAVLLAAVKKGELSEEILDTSVERVLRIILNSPTFCEIEYSNAPDLVANAKIARRAAAESMVLLKNEAKTLPLVAPQRIALFGNASYDLIVGGTGSGDVNEAYSVSLDAGLEGAGYTLDPAFKEQYVQYIAEIKASRQADRRGPLAAFLLPPPIPEMPVNAASVRQAVQDADVAVITLGRNSGEFTDRTVEGDFDLADAERALIERVSETFRSQGKPVVVVMNVGGVTEVASWRDKADAILLAWQPGQEGGNAMTDVLGGAVNPSGRLSMTFPITYADVPSADNFPGKELANDTDQADLARPPMFGKPAEVVYEEGIFVGYRYYQTFGVNTAYDFGYGLSYTSFTYDNLKLSASTFDDAITANVTVTNTGDVAGKEVVQIYVGAPIGKLDRPESELRAFAKTKLLQPGESQTLNFTLSARDLTSFDTARSAWIAPAGAYTVKVGASSQDIRQHKTFTLPREKIVKEMHSVLMPKSQIDELKAPIRHKG